MTGTEPIEPPDPAEPTEPTEAPVAGTPRPRPRRRPTPVVRWIKGLSQAAYAGVLVAVVVLLLVIAVAVNRGERVGPVRPANPPVGGPGLPATRL